MARKQVLFYRDEPVWKRSSSSLGIKRLWGDIYAAFPDKSPKILERFEDPGNARQYLPSDEKLVLVLFCSLYY